MILYPTGDEVCVALGDKVIDAFAEAVSLTRDDLTAYRSSHPTWMVDHSERGLAGWIHDRLWANLMMLLNHIPDVTPQSSEPIREIVVNDTYRVRFKRHDISGSVAAYPTQGSFAFFAQPTVPSFEGMELLHLIAGYVWSRDDRTIGEAVLSLRDGKDNVIWLIPLDARATAAAGLPGDVIDPTPIAPDLDAPVAPVIEIVYDREDEHEAGEPS